MSAAVCHFAGAVRGSLRNLQCPGHAYSIVMGNRIYLCCTSFESMPGDNQWDAFFKNSGAEYEAAGHLPFLWLALFDEACIRINPADRNGFSDDERAYAYLVGRRSDCLQRIQRVRDITVRQPNTPASLVLDEWIDRLSQESHPFIMVRTEELDWMGQEGDLAAELRKGLGHLQESLARAELKFSNTIRYVCGLSELDEFHACEPAWLVGWANGSVEWPRKAAPEMTMTPMPRKVWWKFWGDAHDGARNSCRLAVALRPPCRAVCGRWLRVVAARAHQPAPRSRSASTSWLRSVLSRPSWRSSICRLPAGARSP